MRIRKNTTLRLLIPVITLSVVMTSCKSDPYGSSWFDEDTLTIGQFLERNRTEFSKSYRLLEEGKLLSTLGGYNPYGEGYTLFLPTDDAIDRFILQNQNYENFEEMLSDTSFLKTLMRYHTLSKKVHADDFPDGALKDTTITGDRLITGFYTENENLLIKVNNAAPIVKPNLEMTNGYIHVISEVLQPSETTGYDWLQQQDKYSILAQAMELCGIRGKLWFDKYTILAEHDSIYHRNGIMNIEDLIDRVATPGMSYSNSNNSFYKFTGYHILGDEFYLNDFDWGKKSYWTLGYIQLVVDVGQEIHINPGIDTFKIDVPETGDASVIDYIRPVWEDCNIMTRTGPVHSISDLLHSESFP